ATFRRSDFVDAGVLPPGTGDADGIPVADPAENERGIVRKVDAIQGLGGRATARILVGTGMSRLSQQRLSKCFALVTGANRGIGFAIARALAREGCDVIISGRDARSLEKAGRELGKL